MDNGYNNYNNYGNNNYGSYGGQPQQQQPQQWGWEQQPQQQNGWSQQPQQGSWDPQQNSWDPQQNNWGQQPQQWNGPQSWDTAPQTQWNYTPRQQSGTPKGPKILVIVLASVLGVLLIALAAVLLIHTGVFGGRDKGNDDGAAADTGVQAEAEAETAAADNSNDIDQAALAQCGVGDTLYFGTYQGESIEWQVLDVQDGAVLVLSTYGLDVQTYDTMSDAVTWETCALRTWLNDDFYNTAFSAGEQALIRTTTVTADANPEYYDIDAGSDTQDKIFALSFDEVAEYFENREDCICPATEYAAGQDAWLSDDGANSCRWWLRTPGGADNYAMYIERDGSVDSFGVATVFAHNCVRPAMWLETGTTDSDAAAQDDSAAAAGDADTQVTDTGEVSAAAAVGDTLTFGNYGGEDIEWRVLAVDGNKVMLISKYGLELFPDESLMMADYSFDTWEDCDLRTWLNGDFYDTAFTDEEKDAILTTTVENPDTFYGLDDAGNYIKNNTGDGITELQSRAAGGNTTEDKVFLLSLDEAQTLFDYTETTLQTSAGDTYTGCVDLQCSAIDSVAGGSTNQDYVTAEGDGCVWWWLRSTGGNDGLNCVVGMDGICQYYYDWHYVCPVVRPVIWIEVS